MEIGTDWALFEEYQLSAFSKLRFDAPEPCDLLQCGKLLSYNRTFDRITPKIDKKLEMGSRYHRAPTTSHDPVIQSFVSHATGDSADETTSTFDYASASTQNDLASEEGRVNHLVFATAQILALLMTAAKSINAWDLVVTKITREHQNTPQSFLFFDERMDGPLETISVAETHPDPPMDPLASEKEFTSTNRWNTMTSLSLEATDVEQFFQQQVLSPPPTHSNDEEVGVGVFFIISSFTHPGNPRTKSSPPLYTRQPLLR